MIEGRTALYRGFMIIIHPYPKRGMSAYRNPGYYVQGLSSFEAEPGADISGIIDEVNDHGEFTQEQFDRLSEGKSDVPTVDTCVGCGNEFLSSELLYEGIEPIVFDPRCNVCMIKQVQDLFGAENVQLPESYRN